MMTTSHTLAPDKPGLRYRSGKSRPQGGACLTIGSSRLKVAQRSLSPPGPEGEAALCGAISRSQDRLVQAMSRHPQYLRNVIGEPGNPGALTVAQLFLNVREMTQHARILLVRTFHASLVNACEGQPEQLQALLSQYRLSPGLCTRLYRQFEDVDDPEVHQAHRQWRQAVNALVERFYLLAMKVVWQQSTFEHVQDELFSRATVALISAAERHQPRLGSFSTFAFQSVSLTLRKGRDDMTGTADDVDPEQVIERMQIEQNAETESENHIQSEAYAQITQKALSVLNPREKVVIDALFCREPDHAQNANTLARELGLTKGRISQIKTGALQKMRTSLESKGLNREEVLA